MHIFTIGYKVDLQGFVAVDSSLYEEKSIPFPLHTSPALVLSDVTIVTHLSDECKMASPECW